MLPKVWSTSSSSSPASKMRSRLLLLFTPKVVEEEAKLRLCAAGNSEGLSGSFVGMVDLLLSFNASDVIMVCAIESIERESMHKMDRRSTPDNRFERGRKIYCSEGKRSSVLYSVQVTVVRKKLNVKCRVL